MYEDNNVNDALGPAYGGHPANMVAQMTDAFNLSQHYHKKVRSMEDVMHLPPPHALADEFFARHPNDFREAEAAMHDAIRREFGTQQLNVAQAERYATLEGSMRDNMTTAGYVFDEDRFAGGQALREQEDRDDVQKTFQGHERSVSRSIVDGHRELYAAAAAANLVEQFEFQVDLETRVNRARVHRQKSDYSMDGNPHAFPRRLGYEELHGISPLAADTMYDLLRHVQVPGFLHA